jgi:hypothetical protein|tara:strand:+ start:68 stop:421 length:354 start_codon:yes stop_codon:yes gene_type:complete
MELNVVKFRKWERKDFGRYQGFDDKISVALSILSDAQERLVIDDGEELRFTDHSYDSEVAYNLINKSKLALLYLSRELDSCGLGDSRVTPTKTVEEVTSREDFSDRDWGEESLVVNS